MVIGQCESLCKEAKGEDGGKADKSTRGLGPWWHTVRGWSTGQEQAAWDRPRGPRKG